MISDSKAESLEAKGLYRRAAARWSAIMHSCMDDKERDMAKRRSDECAAKAKRAAVVTATDFSGLRQAATETQNRMGIAPPRSGVIKNRIDIIFQNGRKEVN
ncbi:PerC family transcriptional regulator [Phytobacter diazotrophicus]|uniref:PerC family transcriptional regulator n=1 Tax=Phytobacter diazotrophicus TaxID=395631 RepID=UPI0014528E7E|nr:PerC family transcriptional regulator [Phytobacter diazotrophicus]QJF16079.1 PerC family transcriptional regulator [Phytobacter diazotrophicus]